MHKDKKFTEKKWPLGFLLLALVIYLISHVYAIKPTRSVASKVDLNRLKTLPKSYESLTACEKESFIWEQRILPSIYKKYPKYTGVDIIGMSFSSIDLKMKTQSDYIPRKWKKYIHAVGSVAKIEFKSKGNHPYTGLFKGADCGFIRMSLTYAPYPKKIGKDGVAPGIAVKFLNDGAISRNFSALTSLDPQGQDYNFFKNKFSNIVPKSKGVGAKIVRSIFKRASKYPEHISVSHLGNISEGGEKIKKVKSPYQLFLVAPKDIHIGSSRRDVRVDFSRIPRGSTLFKVYAVDSSKIEPKKGFSKSIMDERFKNSIHIGDIITKSAFTSSQFGDDFLFFNHKAFD